LKSGGCCLQSVLSQSLQLEGESYVLRKRTDEYHLANAGVWTGLDWTGKLS
jgi:hypothetical protein